jgi:hypothetical protein
VWMRVSTPKPSLSDRDFVQSLMCGRDHERRDWSVCGHASVVYGVVRQYDDAEDVVFEVVDMVYGSDHVDGDVCQGWYGGE